MSVGRICTREVHLVDPDESVREAAERMRQRIVGCLVILNEAQEPVGIVTDRDLVVRVLAPGKDPSNTAISEVMTAPPVTVSAETPIEDALALMTSHGFRRLPVVDHQRQLVGLLTLDDVLMLLAEESARIGQLLEQQGPFVAPRF